MSETIIPDWKNYPIIKRLDGSYVVTKGGFPYHVPNEGEFADFWVEVNAYTIEHAENVTEEPPPPPPTPEQIQKQFTDAIQDRLDSFAQTRMWDTAASCALRWNSKVPQYRVEGQYMSDTVDDTWVIATQILNDVLSGERPMPTLDEVMAELPPLEWPEAA